MKIRTDIFDEIISIWNMPVNERPNPEKSREYFMDDRVKSYDVARTLWRNYSKKTTEVLINQYLHSQTLKFKANVVPTKRDMFLITCCLDLISSNLEMHIPIELAMSVVSTFDAGMCYPHVEDLIISRLTESEVLQALNEGLSETLPVDVNFAATEGIRLYAGKGRPDEDKSRLKAIIANTEKSLKKLQSSQDMELRKNALRAVDWLSAFK